jgi:hypothetical protein
MRHTIVIETPDGADPNEVERWATQQIEAQPYSTDGHGGRDYLRVVEYHQEQMTMSEVVDSLARPAPPEGEA